MGHSKHRKCCCLCEDDYDFATRRRPWRPPTYVRPINLTQFRGIQAKLTECCATIITNENKVMFDTISNDQSLNVNYNSTTGEFLITRPGNYNVSWWVVTDGASETTTVAFSLMLNGSEISKVTSPNVTGQVVGNSLISVGAVPAVITLANSSASDIRFAEADVQANMLITEVTS